MGLLGFPGFEHASALLQGETIGMAQHAVHQTGQLMLTQLFAAFHQRGRVLGIQQAQAKTPLGRRTAGFLQPIGAGPPARVGFGGQRGQACFQPMGPPKWPGYSFLANADRQSQSPLAAVPEQRFVVSAVLVILSQSFQTGGRHLRIA